MILSKELQFIKRWYFRDTKDSFLYISEKAIGKNSFSYYLIYSVWRYRIFLDNWWVISILGDQSPSSLVDICISQSKHGSPMFALINEP